MAVSAGMLELPALESESSATVGVSLLPWHFYFGLQPVRCSWDKRCNRCMQLINYAARSHFLFDALAGGHSLDHSLDLCFAVTKLKKTHRVACLLWSI